MGAASSTASWPAPAPPPLRGVIAAAATPAGEDGGIDLKRLRAHCDWLLARGCHAVVLFGTTGEGPSLATEEKLGALAALRAGGFDTARAIPAAMTASAAEARRMAAGAAEAGCRALLLLPPFFYGQPEEAALADYVAGVAGAAPGLPILLYHIPALSRVGFGHGAIAAIRGRIGAQLAGIKDSSMNRAHTLALARAFPDLAVFTGMDCDLPALLAAGGAGIIGGVPNLNPHGLRAVFDDPADAAAAARAVALLEVVMRFSGPAPIKALLARLHRDPAWLRPFPPLSPLPEAGRAALAAGFEAAGFDFGVGLRG